MRQSLPVNTTPLLFEEWGRARIIKLSDEEARILRKHSDAIRCEHVGTGRYRVGPLPGFVGTLRLSKFTVLTVQPRLPMTSFGPLVSLAYDEVLIPTRSDLTSVGVGDLSSWCISQIVAEAQRLCRLHFRPDYIEKLDRRTSPRGRLIFDGLSPDYRGGIRCISDDFTYDTELNRYIKSGLAKIRTFSVSAPWRPALSRLLLDLTSITNLPSPKLPVTSLNGAAYSHYRPLVTLIKLALANEGSEFSQGTTDVSAFFFRLHDLFERAVFNSFRRSIAGSTAISQPVNRTAAIHIGGEPHLGISFKPDVAVMRPTVALRAERGKWQLVVDAKYRNPIHPGRFKTTFRNENIYQMMAYCRVFDAPGLLIYPRVDQDVNITYQVGETRFAIRTINLQSESLRDEFDRVATEAIEELRNS